MSFEEKMEACKTAKEKGNEFFKVLILLCVFFFLI